MSALSASEEISQITPTVLHGEESVLTPISQMRKPRDKDIVQILMRKLEPEPRAHAPSYPTRPCKALAAFESP